MASFGKSKLQIPIVDKNGYSDCRFVSFEVGESDYNDDEKLDISIDVIGARGMIAKKIVTGTALNPKKFADGYNNYTAMCIALGICDIKNASTLLNDDVSSFDEYCLEVAEKLEELIEKKAEFKAKIIDKKDKGKIKSIIDLTSLKLYA